MAKVLIIEDDEFIAEELSEWLRKEKYTVDLSLTGEDGLYRLKHYDYDIAIVDWNLPDIQGVDICNQVRKIKEDLPMLMLTSRGNLSDKIEGLDAGAFDYIVKPCPLAELSARLRALLRRLPDSDADKQLKFADLIISPDKREVSSGGQLVHLSATEYDILLLLVQNQGSEIDYKFIGRSLGKEEDEGLRDRMRTHMKNLRQKLSQSGSSLKIEYAKQGYQLVAGQS